ncbi:uncharacterized protein LOC132722826 isoform X2 [Ruditapes philippinarum]|uniref:uncharacterized protein LOC132722826 isoform X2 n=1 Tax=Ruditapes philippinarum TaxID=129788 RepID=UPI00295A75AF|nr:uncharacterized protein LOC132722826 isoform X2 [Ruditapes philippinarum]
MALHDVGASNLRDLADYKKCGNLHEKRHGKFNKLVRGKWCPCFLIVSRISKTSPSWALFCYHDQFSTRAHHVFILRECESVDDYKSEDEPIIGFCVTFIDKQRKMLIFACPSKESKEIWMQALRSGITESQSCSADSGISSGGSLMMDPVSNTYVTESTIRQSRYGLYEDMDQLPVGTDQEKPSKHGAEYKPEADANSPNTQRYQRQEAVEMASIGGKKDKSHKHTGREQKVHSESHYYDYNSQDEHRMEKQKMTQEEQNSTDRFDFLSVTAPLPSTENTQSGGTQETSHIGGDDNTCVKTMAVPDEFDSNENYENLVFNRDQKK